MTTRRLRFTATAQRHVRRERSWWIENRDHVEVFATELEAALRILPLLPGTGTKYVRPGIVGVRRVYLPKIACHLYYTFDERDVLVRALWGARRLRGPQLKQ